MKKLIIIIVIIFSVQTTHSQTKPTKGKKTLSHKKITKPKETYWTPWVYVVYDSITNKSDTITALRY